MKITCRSLITIIAGLLVSLSLFAGDPEPPEAVTDGKIVGISSTTNQVQLQGSQFVQPKIQFTDLRSFANTMITDYQSYQNTLMSFAQREGVSPEPSKTAFEIQERGEQVLADLSKLDGVALEKRYIEAQIELHLKTIDTIDRIFLPGATHAELRNMVNAIRPTVQSRLEWILRIQAAHDGESD